MQFNKIIKINIYQIFFDKINFVFVFIFKIHVSLVDSHSNAKFQVFVRFFTVICCDNVSF